MAHKRYIRACNSFLHTTVHVHREASGAPVCSRASTALGGRRALAAAAHDGREEWVCLCQALPIQANRSVRKVARKKISLQPTVGLPLTGRVLFQPRIGQELGGQGSASRSMPGQHGLALHASVPHAAYSRSHQTVAQSPIELVQRTLRRAQRTPVMYSPRLLPATGSPASCFGMVACVVTEFQPLVLV